MSAILVNKKNVRLYISLLLLCFLMIPSFSMEGNPQAKKEQLLIYVNQATTMYKSKGKYKSKLSPSIYKQYSKSGSWVKNMYGLKM